MIRTATFRNLWLLWFLLSSVASAQTPVGAPTEQSIVPEDTAIIEVDAPSDATISVDGKEYDEQRRFTFQPLVPGKRYRTNVTVRFANGGEAKRSVSFSAGQSSTLVIAASDDAAVLELAYPDQTQVVVDEVDEGTKQRFEFRLLKFGERKLVSLELILPNGKKEQRTAWLWGGQRVILSPQEAPPALASAVWQLENPCGSHVQFSSNGKLLVTYRYDDGTSVWEKDSGRLLRHFAGVSGGKAFFTQQQKVLSKDQIGNVALWDLATDDKIVVEENVNASDMQFGMSQDGRSLVTTSGYDAFAQNRDLRTDATRIIPRPIGTILNRDGRRSVRPGSGETLEVWDTERTRILQVLNRDGTDNYSN